MTPEMTRACLALLLVSSGFSACADAGNPKNGAGVFVTQCSECHSVREGKDRKGPSLFGVLGRQAGTNSGFAYSAAMKQNHVAWTAERLDAYITNPKKTVPGGNMKFDGLDNAAERADLIAYLASQGKP